MSRRPEPVLVKSVATEVFEDKDALARQESLAAVQKMITLLG